jgi:hypothetical protein
MANKWGIPKEVEELVKIRDTSCVYCGINFKFDNAIRKHKPSWEHIVNDIRINTINNIALCCVSCNASKGAKELEDWINSSYCQRKNITLKTVSDVVKSAYINKPKL